MLAAIGLYSFAHSAIVADYRFDGNLLDSSGNGFHATPHGTISFDSGTVFFDNPTGNVPATHWITLGAILIFRRKCTG
jgi:hypothetical protein